MQNQRRRTGHPAFYSAFIILHSAFPTPRSSREIRRVSLQQRIHVRGEEIDLAVDLLHLARLEAADAEVAVEADDHALEQFLARLEGDGADHLVVGGEAADQ